VRIVDLDKPLRSFSLPRARLGGFYRSLMVVVRLGGDPLGAAVVSVSADGVVSRDRLARELRRQLGAELREALARRGIEMPASLADGVAAPRRRDRPKQSRERAASVVLTTCRDPVAVERALRSIFACDYDDFEVIVVENRPGSPVTKRMLEDTFAADARLRYVEEPTPGLSSARNAGLAVAQGDVVAFTDDDVVVDPGWIRRSVQAFEGADDVACVTGLILPLELETETQLLFEQFAGLGKGFDSRIHRHEAPDADPLATFAPGSIGAGANTVVRADVALELGGFDATLGTGTPALGGEDLDFYMRVLRAGHAIAYEPSALIWHAHRHGGAPLRRQVYRHGVGLGATFGKVLVAGPERTRVLRSVPASIRDARDPSSRRNADQRDEYPRRLDRLERLGMVVGPAAYVASAVMAMRREHLPSAHGAKRHGPTVALERLILASGEVVEVVDVAPAVARPRRRAVRVASRERTQAMASNAERALVAGALAMCLLAPLSVVAPLPAELRFAPVIAFLCLAPGTALVASLRGRLEPGLVLGASLGVSAVLAQSMLWLGTWHPKVCFFGLAAICLPVLAARLDLPMRSRRITAGERVTAMVGAVPRAVFGHVALVTVAMGAWGASLTGADLARISGIGLLPALPPTYFIALGMLLAGFALAITRQALSPRLLALYVLALVLVIHGTTPLLYDEPRYPWTYKHIAVVDLIARQGRVDRHLDIYNNWPGFFALNAVLSTVSGLSARVYAEWAQVFWNLADVMALRFALRGVTKDERLVWMAVWLFLLGNWVGQDYFAPQAFAFFLALVVLGLCLRCSPWPVAPRSRPGRWWATRLDAMRDVVLRRPKLDEPRNAPPLSPVGAVVVGAPCCLALVVSHQLTPVILLAGVTGLAVFARRVPARVPAAMAVVEAWWLALSWSYLTAHFDLFSIDPTSNGAPPGYERGQGLPGLALVGQAAQAECALIAALAIVGFVRRIRARRWDAAAVVLIVAPVIVVLLQSYSGEGRYRLYLFALPWTAFFAAAWLARTGGSRLAQALHRCRIIVVTAALGVCLLLAYFGLEMANRVTTDDVAAGEWFDQHGPRDSLMVEPTSDSISRVTGGYARVFDPDYPGALTLTNEAEFRGHRLGSADLPRIGATLRGYDAMRTFVILNVAEARFARLYGTLPAGWEQTLGRALQRSRSFRLVYRRGGASIFEYVPPVSCAFSDIAPSPTMRSATGGVPRCP
jgi:GT2 family glycosyltransferase